MPNVLDPWESYTTDNGRRVVFLSDDTRTLFTFEEGLVPNYIAVNKEYGLFSFYNEIPHSPDNTYHNVMQVWRVFVD